MERGGAEECRVTIFIPGYPGINTDHCDFCTNSKTKKNFGFAISFVLFVMPNVLTRTRFDCAALKVLESRSLPGYSGEKNLLQNC